MSLAVVTDYSPIGGDTTVVGPFKTWASAERHARIVQARLDAEFGDGRDVLARVIPMSAPREATTIERRLAGQHG